MYMIYFVINMIKNSISYHNEKMVITKCYLNYTHTIFKQCTLKAISGFFCAQFSLFLFNWLVMSIAFAPAPGSEFAFIKILTRSPNNLVVILFPQVGRICWNHSQKCFYFLGKFLYGLQVCFFTFGSLIFIHIVIIHYL